MIRAAQIDPETGIVTNVIIVNEGDLTDTIIAIPYDVTKSNIVDDIIAYMHVEAETTKWVGHFTDLEGNPLEIQKHVFLDIDHIAWYYSEDNTPYAN